MKKLNLDLLIKLLILIGFSVFFIKLLISNEVILYVHPRIIPFIIFGIISMIIISIFLIIDNTQNSRKKFNIKNYIAFIIPLVMIFFFEISDLKSSLKTTDKKINNSQLNDYSNTTQTASDNDTVSNPNFENNNTEKEKPHNKLNICDNTIVINSKNFVSSLDEIINNSTEYDGTKVEITGFVYNAEELNLEENQFILSRYMMVCCAADMQIAGIRCQYDDKDTHYDKDTWVKVEGRIKNDYYEGSSDPLILIDKIQLDENPDTSYVYPY